VMIDFWDLDTWMGNGPIIKAFAWMMMNIFFIKTPEERSVKIDSIDKLNNMISESDEKTYYLPESGDTWLPVWKKIKANIHQQLTS
jgi:hypothetical protein